MNYFGLTELIWIKQRSSGLDTKVPESCVSSSFPKESSPSHLREGSWRSLAWLLVSGLGTNRSEGEGDSTCRWFQWEQGEGEFLFYDCVLKFLRLQMSVSVVEVCYRNKSI